MKSLANGLLLGGITLIFGAGVSIMAKIENVLSYMLPVGLLFVGIGFLELILEKPVVDSLENERKAKE